MDSIVAAAGRQAEVPSLGIDVVLGAGEISEIQSRALHRVCRYPSSVLLLSFSSDLEDDIEIWC